jgi:hypothetical protein
MAILPCLFLAHILFMNNTLPHIKINLFLTHSFYSLLLPPTQHTPLPLSKPPGPSMSLFPLTNGSFEILPSNQWPPHPLKPMRIVNDLPSN